MSASVTVAGVDGCKAGWVAVITQGGAFHRAVVYPRITDLLEDWHTSSAIGVDIPIGLPVASVREADALAQRALGRRRSSVFITPHRDVLMAETYGEARQLSVARHGRGVSAQAYALRSKILEVDAAVRGGAVLREVHPEMAFRAMAGAPLDHAKRTWNGQMMRRSLLAKNGIEVPDVLDDAGAVAVDDLLDASAVAWSARRIALGMAESVPDPPERLGGIEAAIWW